jgi:hypothetical protein
MSFQTTDPSEHGYLYNNCLVIHNKKAVGDAETHSYINTNYSYNVPNDEHKTIIIDKNVFSVREYYNIFSIVPIVYNMQEHSELTISCLTSVITKMISSKTSLKWLLNTINFKIFLFFPDNKKMPFGFVKDSYHEKDIFDLAFPEKLAVYIKTFQFDDKGDVKLLPTEDNSLFTRSLYESIIYGKTATASTTSIAPIAPIAPPQTQQNFSTTGTANPFGTSSATTNPFGVAAATSAPTSNPFGASTKPNPFGTTSNPNPFGAGTVSNTNQFGTTSSNPYGQPNLFNKTSTQKLYTYGQ